MLKDGEELCELFINDLKIIQSNDTFRFGTDSVMLANYATVKRGDTIADLGSGSGIISLLLTAKAEIKKIYALEINEKSCDLAKRSVALNSLEDKIEILNCDLRNENQTMPHSFDLVVSNPPYKEKGSGFVNTQVDLLNARHETTCTLEDVVKKAALLLRFGGLFSLVQKPERLCDIIFLMRKYEIEPKRLQFVFSNIKKEPSLILIEGKSKAKSGIRILSPIILS